MPRVATLTADLRAETSAFEVDLRRARSTLSSTQVTMNRSLAKMDAGFSKLTRAASAFLGGLNPLSIAVSAVAGSSGLGLMVKNSIATADAIAKAADSAGIGVERLQSLSFAAEQSGVSAAQLEDGMRRLNRRLGLFVQDGGGPAAKAFKDLGLSSRIASGELRGAEAVLDASVAALSRIDSAAVQAALASQLFGDDAGPKLALLLRQGASGIADLEQQARDLDLVLSEDLVRSAEVTNDAFSILSKTISTKTTEAFATFGNFLGQLSADLGLIDLPEMTMLTQDIERTTYSLEVLNEKLRIFQTQGGVTPQTITNTKNDIAEAESRLAKLQARLDELKGDIAGEPLRIDIPGGGAGPVTDDKFKGPRPPDRLDAFNKREAEQIQILQRIDEEHRRLYENEFQRITRLEQEAIASLDRRLLSEEEYADAVNKIRETATERRSVENARVAEESSRALEAERRGTEDLASTIEGSLLRSVGDLANGYGDLRSVAVSALQDILRSVLDLNSAQGGSGGGGLLSGLFKLGSSFFGGGSSLAGVGPTPGTLITPFAKGGDFSAGQPMLVGEQGPELMLPKAAGTVIPASVTKAISSAGGRGGGDVYQIDARGADREGLARLEAMIRELNGSIEKRSVAAVTDSRRRNPALFA